MIRGYLAQTYGKSTPLWLSVMHGQFADQAEALATLLKETLNAARVEILRISSVLGVHTGPGIVGVAAVPYALMDI
jgi:fatty acid-binding protein DegV